MRGFDTLKKIIFCIAGGFAVIMVISTMSFNVDSDAVMSGQKQMTASTYNKSKNMGSSGQETKETIEGFFKPKDDIPDDSATSGVENTDNTDPVPYTPSTVDPGSGGNTPLPTPTAGQNPAPIYKQGGSSPWANYLYCESDPTGAPCGSPMYMKKSGCGVCALAMGISYLTGTQITPTDMMNKWNEIGPRSLFVQHGAGLVHAGVSKTANAYGLKCNAQYTPLTKQFIQQTLDAGGVIIWRTGSGWFTKGGHFMCIPAYATDDHECVYIANSSGVTYTGPNGESVVTDDNKAWNIDEFLANGVSGAKGWAIFKQ